MSKPRKVRCVETGEVFASLTLAGLSIGQVYASNGKWGKSGDSHHSNICHIANNHKGAKTAGGYHWEFVDSPITSTTPSLKRTEDKLPKIYKAIKRKPPKQPKIDYPPEGYVYIFRNDWHPENVYKIGSTDNLEGRRSAARTWGPYKCEFYLEVADCKLVESKVHVELSRYKVDRDDLGSEHFKIPLEKAIQALNSVTLGVILGDLMKAA